MLSRYIHLYFILKANHPKQEATNLIWNTIWQPTYIHTHTQSKWLNKMNYQDTPVINKWGLNQRNGTSNDKYDFKHNKKACGVQYPVRST